MKIAEFAGSKGFDIWKVKSLSGSYYISSFNNCNLGVTICNVFSFFFIILIFLLVFVYILVADNGLFFGSLVSMN